MRRFALPAAAIAASAMLTGCAITAGAPTRSLDPEIRRVYVPQATNATTKFGIGPQITRALQDAILADGRLELVKESQADARIEIQLTEYSEDVLATDDDEFPLVSSRSVKATADLWDPYQKVRTVPLARREVRGTYTFISDPRRVLSDSSNDADLRLAETVGRALVREILTGADLPPTPSQAKALQRQQQVAGPTRAIPAINPDRLPDPGRIPVQF